MSIVPALLLPPTAEDSTESAAADEASDADSEEGDAQTRALMQLFDISLELLSLNADQNQSTRGLRDCVKKVWQAVCAIHGSSLSVDVIDNIVGAVIGEAQDRGEDEEDGEGADGEGSDGEDEGSDPGSDAGSEDAEEEQDSSSEMDVEEAKPAAKNANSKKSAPATAKISKAGGAGKVETAEQEGEEEEEEDVVISREDAFDMLTEGMEGTEEVEGEGEGLQHSAELDDALAQMIALKQQSRKAGVLLAHKQALLVRSRSIDILEVRLPIPCNGYLFYGYFEAHFSWKIGRH